MEPGRHPAFLSGFSIFSAGGRGSCSPAGSRGGAGNCFTPDPFSVALGLTGIVASFVAPSIEGAAIGASSAKAVKDTSPDIRQHVKANWICGISSPLGSCYPQVDGSPIGTESLHKTTCRDKGWSGRLHVSPIASELYALQPLSCTAYSHIK